MTSEYFKPPTEAELAVEEQQMIVENSLPVVFEVFDRASEAGVEQPVIVLLDCEDEIGGEIARQWLGDEVVDDVIAEQAADREAADEVTIFAHAFPWAECRVEVPAVFEYLAPLFEGEPPADGFVVISVTSGGALALEVPFDARDEN